MNEKTKSFLEKQLQFYKDMKRKYPKSSDLFNSLIDKIEEYKLQKEEEKEAEIQNKINQEAIRQIEGK